MPAMVGADGAFVPPATNLVCNCDAALISGVVFEGASGSGNPIKEWTDQSGNGEHFVKTAPNQPDWIAAAQNGLGAISFDRANFEHLENLTPPITGLTPGQGFFVMRCTDLATVSSGSGAFGTVAAGDYYTNSTDHVLSSFGSNTQHDVGIPPLVRSFSLVEFRSQAGDWAFTQNGVELFVTGVNTVSWWTGFFLAVNRSSVYGSFEFGQMLLYDAIQAGAPLAAIRAGLNAKWALGF